MKCTYRVNDPRLLLEANPGELFVPLGPHLVECVCAMASHEDYDGVQSNVVPTERRNPDASIPVVVVACRVESGEPEYFPAGFETLLPGASPVVFVEQVEPLALRPRNDHGLLGDSIDRFFKTVFGDDATPSRDDLSRPELMSRL